MSNTASTERHASVVRNWLARDQQGAPGDAWEVPLFTDAHLTGELTEGFGPYEVLNTIAGPGYHECVPSAVLRLRIFGPHETPSFENTDTANYHGGTLADEVAALMSLEFGIRLKAGPASRWFRQGGDPLGKPVAFEHMISGNPTLPIPRSLSIPMLRRSTNIAVPGELSKLCALPASHSNALVKAARQYQEAVWVCDSDASLAWLLLVSAVETAANHWRAMEDPPIDRLRASRPDLEGILLEAGGEALLLRVAAQIAPYMGATKKFCDFLTEHAPAPPEPRPPSWAAIEWEPEGLRKSLTVIYKHRSRALHGGTPFPSPLAHIMRVSDGDWLPEHTISEGAAAGGTVWSKQDMPMLLWTFHHLVRGALTSWWAGLNSQRGSLAST